MLRKEYFDVAGLDVLVELRNDVTEDQIFVVKDHEGVIFITHSFPDPTDGVRMCNHYLITFPNEDDRKKFSKNPKKFVELFFNKRIADLPPDWKETEKETKEDLARLAVELDDWGKGGEKNENN